MTDNKVHIKTVTTTIASVGLKGYQGFYICLCSSVGRAADSYRIVL